MITLYVKSNCQYSARARAALDMYGVPFTEKNIADPTVEHELMEIGGKHKVPFMVDGETKLYESEVIAEYVARQYGGGLNETKKLLTVHKSTDGEVCGV